MTSRQITGSGGGGGGGAASSVTLKDGADPAILATVLDLTASNPQAVITVDSNGDYIAPGGGGTQYDQGTAGTATDKLTMAGAVRKDTPAVDGGVADGDRLVLSTDATGRLWTNPAITAASGAFASGALASGAVASGAIASGAVASGAIASGAVASGAVASGAFAAGSIVAGAIAAGATSFVKLEDVAAAGGDAGVPAMAIQLATPADTAADGDYAMLQMSAGRLWANAAITAASGSIASGAIASGAVASGAIASGAVASGAFAAGSIAAGAVAAGATSFVKLEDVAAAGGDAGVPAMAIQLATPANTAADGDYAMLQMNAGRLWSSATIDAALPAGTNVIGHVIADTGSTTAVTGNVTVVQATSTNLKADITIAAAQTLATVTTVGTVTTLTGSSIAHDAADSGNPHKIGGRAIASSVGQTLVAANDRTDAMFDLDGTQLGGRQVAWGDLLSERVSNTDGASTALSTFGATASQRNMITAITVHNAHATTNGYVDIRDGTGGAVLWTIPLPATGGAVLQFNPPLRQPTQNTALAFDVSAAITTIYLSFNGFKTKL